MKRDFVYILIVILFSFGVFVFLSNEFAGGNVFIGKESRRVIVIDPNQNTNGPSGLEGVEMSEEQESPLEEETQIPGQYSESMDGGLSVGGAVLGEPMSNPPSVIRAIYFTSWSASSEDRINYAINLAKRTPINAIVIDIKDFSGVVSYNIDLPVARSYGANTNRIRDLSALTKRFHDNDIYVIARITVFQDPILAVARPDLAVHSAETQGLWYDRKGITWIDPGAREAWDYNIAIAKDVLRHGIDEINFDYIRFPSDGNMRDVVYNHWDGSEPRSKVIRNFFEHMRKEMPDAVISADLFGLTTINRDDLGIGQIIEDAYEFFDVVAPMTYPSHYAYGFLGFSQPAFYPYEVVFESMRVARNRLKTFIDGEDTEKDSVDEAKSLGDDENGGDESVDEAEIGDKAEPTRKIVLRPWIQDFDLGAVYNADMVRAQIQATKDALGELYGGYMLWSPRNVYTEGGIIE